MPCIRCDRVQTDPDPARPGQPWAIAVIDRHQVLICPVCQSDDPAWFESVDSCPSCGSTRLKVTMGSVICRACGADS